MARLLVAACLAMIVAGSIVDGSGVVAAARASDASTAIGLQACRLVSGQTLETFYPAMPGWVRGAPTSETDTQELVSRTTVDFERDTNGISVEIMDSCRNPDVLALIVEALKVFPPATRGTVQRHLTVNGFPAYEEWTAEAGNGELHVLVAGRFMVKVTAATTDLPTLENAARLIPMQKLAAFP